MLGGYGGNGQFVRARTEEDAKLLVAEQEQRRRIRLPAAGTWLGWVALAVLAVGLVVLWVLYG